MVFWLSQPKTRSDLLANTALTVNAVIIASPIPIKTCVPTIAPNTVLIEKVALAPIAYWSTNPAAAAGTDRSAAINAVSYTHLTLPTKRIV